MKSMFTNFNFSILSPSNINFKVLFKPRIVYNSIKSNTPWIKFIVIFEIAALIASVIMVGFGAYQSITKDVPDPNNEVNEAVLMNFNKFNPIFNSKNSVEERITNMLYMPLYVIENPKFGSSNISKVNTSYLIDRYIWSSDKPEQVVTFKLKPNLKFSNGDALTSEDVKYTFDAIKTNKSTNKKYRQAFQDLELKIVNDLEYEVSSATARPTMLYDLDFSPVSKKYMSLVPIDNLFNSEQTTTPKVTSGFYQISKSQLIDKDYSFKFQSPNPIVGKETINLLKLDKYNSSNSSLHAASPYWVFKKYDTTQATSTLKRVSIESDIKLNNVDLFIRSYDENPVNPERPEEIKKTLALKQDFINSDRFLNFYFNTKPEISRTKPSTQLALRNFINCKLVNNTFPNWYFENTPKERKSYPIQINSNQPVPDCSKELPDTQFKTDKDSTLAFNTADSNLTLKVINLGYETELEKFLPSIFESKLGKIKTEVTGLNNNSELVKQAFASSSILAQFDIVIYPTEIKNLKMNSELSRTVFSLVGDNEDVIKSELLAKSYHDKSFSSKESDELAKFYIEKSLINTYGNFKIEINHNFKNGIKLDNNGSIGYEFVNWYNKTNRDWFFK
jgi:hypothetical protein